MAESQIPVDLLNPGQVFACLGLMEATEILLGDTTAVFDWSGRDTKFRVSATGEEEPVERVMRFLEDAKIITRTPSQSDNVDQWKESWGEKPESDPQPDPFPTPFPFPDPDSPATLPVVLRENEDVEITLDYWGDATKRDNVKFWAGAGGCPGAAILRDSLELVRGKMQRHAKNPFMLSAPQSNSFRFDWRRDYIPRDIGFSLNAHRDILAQGFPLVEILAAIGVTNARPARIDKLEYRYGVLGGPSPFDPVFVRAGLGAEKSPVPGLPFRCFVMRLDWPGQENQARCITQVTEIDNE